MMSESSNPEQDVGGKSNKFARRKSKIQKGISDCVEAAQGKFINVLDEATNKLFTIGFEKRLPIFIENNELLKEFLHFNTNEMNISEQFYSKILIPMIFETPEEQSLKVELESHIWNRLYCEGGKTAYNKDSERMAWHRLKKKIRNKDEELCEALYRKASGLLECDWQPLLRECYVQCKVLLGSVDTYYSCFAIPPEVRGQLAETICMNTCVNAEFDTYQEICERFVRNQLLLFSKTHHASKASEPSKRVSEVVIDSSKATFSEAIEKCIAIFEKTKPFIFDSQKAFLVLIEKAKQDVSPADGTITKTVLRQWANEKLSQSDVDYRIKNAYDSAFCRMLDHLGETYNFSVRGSFRYPLALSTMPAPKARTSNAKGITPDEVINKFDSAIEKLTLKLEETKTKKRQYMDSPEVQSYSKRQRVPQIPSQDITEF